MNQTYGRLVSRAAIAATAMASALLLIKIFAWWYTGSVSILAALVDSLVDIAASLTNLLVVRYSLQPADDEHTFGHGKAESLAALAQSMFISGSALFLFLTSIQNLIKPTPMKRRTKNAKAFHDKCENFSFRASNETAVLITAFYSLHGDHLGYG